MLRHTTTKHLHKHHHKLPNQHNKCKALTTRRRPLTTSKKSPLKFIPHSNRTILKNDTRQFYSQYGPSTPFTIEAGGSPYPMNGDFHPTGKPIHRATTILCVRKGDKVVMIGDGQVSMGPTVVKPNAKKIRRIGNGNVITGFAGSTADAFALLGLLETHLEQHPGQLLRAAVETAKGWRTDKYTRHLEAMLIASDENISLCIGGNGDVIESHDGLLGIGSGSMYALSAARALIDIPDVDAMTIAKKAMNIAADICVYTNHNFIIDSIDVKPSVAVESSLSAPPSIAPADEGATYYTTTPQQM